MEGADHLRNIELCVYFVRLELQLEEYACLLLLISSKKLKEIEQHRN